MDDVIIEDEDGEGSTATAQQLLKELREKLKKAEAEANENLAGWQRSKADYVNLGKRMREMEESLSRAGVTTVVRALVDVFDSVEASAHDAVLKQLDTSLQRIGVTRYRPTVGDVFEPEREEAVQTVATKESTSDNTIHSVLQSGFSIDGIVIRPARVVVFHYSAN